MQIAHKRCHACMLPCPRNLIAQAVISNTWPRADAVCVRGARRGSRRHRSVLPRQLQTAPPRATTEVALPRETADLDRGAEAMRVHTPAGAVSQQVAPRAEPPVGALTCGPVCSEQEVRGHPGAAPNPRSSGRRTCSFCRSSSSSANGAAPALPGPAPEPARACVLSGPLGTDTVSGWAPHADEDSAGTVPVGCEIRHAAAHLSVVRAGLRGTPSSPVAAQDSHSYNCKGMLYFAACYVAGSSGRCSGC